MAASVWELHCHGGRVVAQALLAALSQQGCRIVDWNEACRLTGESAIATAARQILANARTARVALVALDQWHGALADAIASIIAAMDAGGALQADARLAALLARSNFGLHLGDPWRVVLAGRPNVGKSSLMNALLGFERAIVFDQPGTTRDVVTAQTAVDGLPVALSDTAGLRPAGDAIEQQGVALARAQAATADLLLFVEDASATPTADDAVLAAEYPNATIVLNKVDVASRPWEASERLVPVSAKTGEGIADLVRHISRRLAPDPPGPGEAAPFTAAQCTSLAEARRLLRSESNAPAARAVLAALLQ
ncbi:MAG: 50S ribosome-binding GTPase [Planctomycetales bacterium]|nr:50S ribosome-binding GTPase [Planctomycetales bacterium]